MFRAILAFVLLAIAGPSLAQNSVGLPSLGIYPQIDVRRYKQVGDVDDTASFQRAINVAEGGNNRTVIVPPGFYTLSAPLIINSSFVQIKGQSSQTTVLKRTADYGDTIKVASGSNARLTFVEISGLKIQADTPPTSGWAINAETVSYLLLEDVQLSTPFSGIRAAGVLDSRLDKIQANWGIGGSTGKIGLSIEPSASAYGGGVSSNLKLTNSTITSAWNPTLTPATPGLDRGLVVTGVDGLWVSDTYFGSCTLSCVYFNNVNTVPVTGILMTNTWIDHGTSYALETAGAAFDNFGDMTLSNMRVYGGSLSPGLFKFGGNVKRVAVANSNLNTTTGDIIQIALSGNGGDINATANDLDFTNQAPTAGSAAFHIVSGANITLRGGTLRLRGYNLLGAKIDAGDGAVIAPDRVLECSNPVSIASGTTNTTVALMRVGGCTSASVIDAGTGTVIK